MTDYRLTQTEFCVIRTADNAGIPVDPDNRDYAEYLAWRAAGGVPDPYVAPPAPPASVLSQDLLAQLTVSDVTAIQAAIASDAGKALFWYSLLAQRDPMNVTSERFLTSVLGAPRMAAIATALGVTIG
jgi:hypothetical protein